jgi:hypothetical protein
LALRPQGLLAIPAPQEWRRVNEWDQVEHVNSPEWSSGHKKQLHDRRVVDGHQDQDPGRNLLFGLLVHTHNRERFKDRENVKDPEQVHLDVRVADP